MTEDTTSKVRAAGNREQLHERLESEPRRRQREQQHQGIEPVESSPRFSTFTDDDHPEKEEASKEKASKEEGSKGKSSK